MQKPDYQRFKTNLKKQVEENPVISIGVFAAAATAAAKLMDANNDRRRTKTRAREIRLREDNAYTQRPRRK